MSDEQATSSDELRARLAKTEADLAKMTKARDALIQAGLGFNASAGKVTEDTRRPATKLTVLVLLILVLLGVAMLSVHRMRSNTRALDRVKTRSPAAGLATAERRQPTRRVAVVGPRRDAVIAVPHLSWLHRAALAPDGKRAAAGGADGAVVLLDLARGDREQRRFTAHRGMVRDLLWIGDELITGGADGRVRRFDQRGKARAEIRPPGAPVRALAASADGKWLAVAADAPGIELHRLGQQPSGAAAAPLKLAAGEGWQRAVAFSADGRLLAGGGEDGKLRLWKLPRQPGAPSGQGPRELEGHPQWVNGLAFSPDGKLLASTGMDKRTCLWDLASGKRLVRLRGHVRRVRALAFSRYGHLLATASLDRRVVLWDVAKRQRHAVLEGHRRQVTSVAFDPTATRFVFTAGGDGTIRLWPLPRREPPSVAELPPPGPGELTLRSNTSGQRARMRVVDQAGEVLERGRRELAQLLRSGPDDQHALPDPTLIKLLYKVASHFGRQRELLVISGFRSPRFNKLRTKQSRQVGEKSLHIKGQAIDFRIAGVAITTLQKYVKQLRVGGLGYYPDSNFIHMDVGPVRYWSGN